MIRDALLLIPEIVDVLNRSPLIVSEGLRYVENTIKRQPPGPLSGVRATILAGFCLLAGGIVLALDGPWYGWAPLFLAGIIMGLRK